MTELLQSAENRRLLNPAFTGCMLALSAGGFSAIEGSGLPFLYCYLILPLALHAETRQRLPGTLATKLVTWTERSSDVLTLLPRRIEGLSRFTSKGILASTTLGLTKLDERGALLPQASDKALLKFGLTSGSAEVEEILKKCLFLGKWLAAAGSAATIFTALGVRFENNAA